MEPGRGCHRQASTRIDSSQQPDCLSRTTMDLAFHLKSPNAPS